jgi:hypothetical protein
MIGSLFNGDADVNGRNYFDFSYFNVIVYAYMVEPKANTVHDAINFIED